MQLLINVIFLIDAYFSYFAILRNIDLAIIMITMIIITSSIGRNIKNVRHSKINDDIYNSSFTHFEINARAKGEFVIPHIRNLLTLIINDCSRFFFNFLRIVG